MFVYNVMQNKDIFNTYFNKTINILGIFCMNNLLIINIFNRTKIHFKNIQFTVYIVYIILIY